MNRAATTSGTCPSAPRILLLLLSYCISGGDAYRVEAPSQYTALQGHLTATVYLTIEPPATEAPLYTWDFDNNRTYPLSTSIASPESNSSNNDLADPGDYDIPGDDVTPSEPILLDNPEPVQALPVVSFSQEDEEDYRPPEVPPFIPAGYPEPFLTLSLFANGSSKPIKTYGVAESVDKISYVFPCGLVVQGGIHFFRLERGEEVLALSGEIEVAWPQISIEVPLEVETYHTDVHVGLRFTGNMCLPSSEISFHSWVDLLYHGVPTGKGDNFVSPTQLTTSKHSVNFQPKKSWNRSLWNSFEEDRNRRALRRFRNSLKGKRKNRKKKKKKKKGRKNGAKRGGRRRRKERKRIENSILSNRTEMNATLLKGESVGSGEVNGDSTKSSSVADDSSTNSTSVDLGRSPFVDKTDSISGPNSGKRKGKRKKGPVGAKGRRKTITRTISGKESDNGLYIRGGSNKGASGQRRRGLKKRKKGRRRKMMFNRQSNERSENWNIQNETLDIPITNTKKTVASEFTLDSEEVIGWMLANRTFVEFKQNGETSENANRSLEGDETLLDEALEMSSTSSPEEQLWTDQMPEYGEPLTEPQTTMPDPETSTHAFIYQTSSFTDNFINHYEETTSVTWNPVYEETVSHPEDQISASPEQTPASEEWFPAYDNLIPGSTEEIPDSSDYTLYDYWASGEQDSELEDQEAEEQIPDYEETTPDPQEQDMTSKMEWQSLNPQNRIPDSSEPPLQKNKRAVITGNSRLHRSFDIDHPPQTPLISSGSRGKGSAWGGGAMIFGKVPLGTSLYLHPHHEIKFPCTDIGPAGIYSVRLATSVATSPVIAYSQWFTVIWSESFSLYVHAASIKPCDGPIGVRLAYPSCIGRDDKVRVYARVRADVTSANPPTEKKYVSEMPVIKGRTSVQFPCATFDGDATEFCFEYVSTVKTGAVSTVVKQCIPTYKPDVIRERGQWGTWSEWTPCTSSCGTGQRLRHRFCDSPPPRNGGEFCKGESIDSVPCEAPECVEPSNYPPPASTPGEEQCECGCTLELASGESTSITASAADCIGTAIWLLKAPAGQYVVAEVAWAVLRPGSQWLKLRDGDSLFSPLLVSLPAPIQTSNSSPSPRRLGHAPRRSSSGNKLILEFRSDVNVTSASINPASWGFLVTVFPTAEALVASVRVSGETSQKGTYWGLLAGMHIAAIVFISALVAAVIVLAVYHWRRYHHYKRARLIPESPYMTPPDTPSRDLTGSSTLTLTEVISLKSLVMRPKIPLSLPLKRKGSSASYSALDDHQTEEPRHSLPNSPFLTRRAVTPSAIRRSSSQLGRILRKGNGNFKKKRRRFGSVDELESRCISPIHETHKEDDGGGGEGKESNENSNKMGEDDSAKYKEYRKSLLAGDVKELRLPHKLVKDKMNLERIRRSAISRSNSNATMRAASSVSELSVNGTDTEMEYDYYDYDMDNASAVPGSLFGLDPLLLAWVPEFIPVGEHCTPPDEGIPLDVIVNSSAANDAVADTTTPTAETPRRPKVLPLEHLNIPHVEPPQNSMETSVRSEEANDRVELQVKVPEEEPSPSLSYDDDDPTPTTEIGSKILNLDDFQFADDTDEEGCEL